ncbi:MAG TPA: hypothetical protein VGH24_06175 [Solirubrobacteraceae bacterium]|jgi:hypothetical protein
MSPTVLPDLRCTDEDARRSLLAASETVHGIDYLEVSANQLRLDVHFVAKQTATGTANLKTVLDAIAGVPANVRITGGERVRHFKIEKVQRLGERLVVTVDQPGDFSTYTLALTHPSLDPAYAAVQFSFKAGCPSRFDCRGDCYCDPPDLPAPAIDYMAKDFDSFRQALIDRLPAVSPDWLERNQADLGIALLELLSYAGDQLSYLHDAVSNEAYLSAARQRISVRRHARLLDYLIDEGASARAFVVAKVSQKCTIPAKTQLLTKRVLPFGGLLPPLPAVLQPGSDVLAERTRTEADAIFETLVDAALAPSLSPITIHTWDLGDCCLPVGTTTLDLEGDLWFDTTGNTRQDAWRLRAGGFLVVEEILGVPTLLPGDADPTHRQVVRLTGAEAVADPLVPGPLTRVTWAPEDALTFPLCVSARDPEGVLTTVAAAHGNVLVADHGERREQWWPMEPVAPGGGGPAPGGLQRGPRPTSFLLQEGPESVWRLTRQADGSYTLPDGPVATMYEIPAKLKLDVTVVSPTLVSTGFQLADDLIDAGMFTREFVAEVTNDGRARIRFGDGTNGLQPADGSFVHTVYRVGRGRVGNVGAETLVHLLFDPPPAVKPPIVELRNPLPARGGADPETISQVKVSAPVAFRSPQMRAVTEADYAEVAARYPGVAGAVARFRWTGSWLTVFLTIDAVDRTALDGPLPGLVKAFVQGFTQTGYDLEVRPPQYVPLDVELFVCVAPDRFRADVEHALLAALSSHRLPGRELGFFNPTRFGFGTPLYLSALYAAAEAVPGVVSVTAKRFSRFYDDDPLPSRPITAGNIDAGLITCGELEVLELDNDPSMPQRGVLTITTGGGR